MLHSSYSEHNKNPVSFLTSATDIIEQTVLPQFSSGSVERDAYLLPAPAGLNNATIEDSPHKHNVPTNIGDHSMLTDRNSLYNMSMVQEILKKTSQTVQDLNSYLSVNDEIKPVKN